MIKPRDNYLDAHRRSKLLPMSPVRTFNLWGSSGPIYAPDETIVGIYLGRHGCAARTAVGAIVRTEQERENKLSRVRRTQLPCLAS